MEGYPIFKSSTFICIGVLWASALYPLLSVAKEVEFSGYVSIQERWFPQAAIDPQQSSTDFSIAAEPEAYWAWDDQSFTLKLFGRWDQRDYRRTHADVREAAWQIVDGNNEWLVGVGKVYWGVIESVHIVDIINQTDLIENPDGEQKLGQPMVRFSSSQDWGTVDFFVMPWFRERTFAGKAGRPRTNPRVDPGRTEYESSAGQQHVDFAMRWSQSTGDWDIGVAGFRGTSRDPDFSLGFDGTEPVLIPTYPVISQFSVDIQATKGDWLWKFESAYRQGQGDRNYVAAAGGFEYTLVGLNKSSMDLGLLLEYTWDQRTISSASPFQDDVFAGVRLTLNDAQSTEALMGVIYDRKTGGRLFNVEASRRFGDDYLLNVQMRIWSNISVDDPSYVFRNDDYIEIDLRRYF